jgi:hypothetical protein
MLGWLEFAAVAAGVTGLVAGVDWLLQKKAPSNLSRRDRNQQVMDQWDKLGSGNMSDARNYRRRR